MFYIYPVSHKDVLRCFLLLVPPAPSACFSYKHRLTEINKYNSSKHFV